MVCRTSLVHIDNSRSKQWHLNRHGLCQSCFVRLRLPFLTATRRYTRRLQAARRIATWRKRQSRRKAFLLALTAAVVARSVPRQLLWTHERAILRSSRWYRVRGRDGSPRLTYIDRIWNSLDVLDLVCFMHIAILP